MDWIDYREKLGIGFNDKEKSRIFITNILNSLNKANEKFCNLISYDEYNEFCTTTGVEYDNDSDYLESIIYELESYEKTFKEFLSRYIAFINSLYINSPFRGNLISSAENFLNRAHIPFDIFLDENKNYFIFPNGAKELDDALVSEPLKWLNNYPNAHKTFCIAIKQYSEGVYIRDVADNLRKALEAFLQEFLGNTKNLESNKNEICKYLGEQSVDGSIGALYQSIINTYKNVNDALVKHNDKIDEKLLEFLLYQTGLLIRMVIVVNNHSK